jgi:hypothetical protein
MTTWTRDDYEAARALAWLRDQAAKECADAAERRDEVTSRHRWADRHYRLATAIDRIEAASQRTGGYSTNTYINKPASP